MFQFEQAVQNIDGTSRTVNTTKLHVLGVLTDVLKGKVRSVRGKPVDVPNGRVIARHCNTSEGWQILEHWLDGPGGKYREMSWLTENDLFVVVTA